MREAKSGALRDERRDQTGDGIECERRCRVAEGNVPGEPGEKREIVLLVEEAGLRRRVRVWHAAGLHHHAGGGEHEQRNESQMRCEPLHDWANQYPTRESFATAYGRGRTSNGYVPSTRWPSTESTRNFTV